MHIQLILLFIGSLEQQIDDSRTHGLAEVVRVNYVELLELQHWLQGKSFLLVFVVALFTVPTQRERERERESFVYHMN